jgi:hypothetical protein
VLDLGDHREIPGNAVTPVSLVTYNDAAFDAAVATNGVFCAATHYWEQEVASQHPRVPTVGEQLRALVERAADGRVRWQSVGDVITGTSAVLA